jgi:hypothetical protein
VIAFGSPSPSQGATLTSSAAHFAFTYNRTSNQTRALTCALSGPTSSTGACNKPVATATGSSSGVSYTGLANGNYTLTVTLRLTDGGGATASRSFTVAVPTCTAGSENFSEDIQDSQPTTFGGGTIDSSYDPNGGVVDGVGGSPLFGQGVAFLYSGDNVGAFTLTFTQPVGSVRLGSAAALAALFDAGGYPATATDTLTAYDGPQGTGNQVGTDSADGTTIPGNTESVGSTTNDIKSFTISAAVSGQIGSAEIPSDVAFTNIVWGCN